MIIIGQGKAGEFWQSRRDLDIWVSDFPQYLDRHRRILRKFGVSDEQLHFDGEATVVATNFTTLVDDNLQHIYLITSRLSYEEVEGYCNGCFG